MALPVFYHNGQIIASADIELDESTAKHIVQVLRMQEGELIKITNGQGIAADCRIKDTGKKRCIISVGEVKDIPPPLARLHLVVAFTKNSSRNEWVLEKATELGVSAIIPLLAHRTEREKFRYERWHNILVSAMLQSQQYYLPQLHEPMNLEKVLEHSATIPEKYIAHCMEDEEKKNLSHLLNVGKDAIILIGPEGDFTEDEVNLCKQNDYRSISIAGQRLRTETAAMTVCAYFNMINYA
jgi:16S rRNA (uracil1498-N3)-methyltransferase